MRPALANIERIENYLLGKMEDAEKNAFENELNQNPELQNQLDIQASITKAIQRIGLTQAAQKSYGKYKTKRLLKMLMIGTIILGVLGVATYFYFNQNLEGDEEAVSELETEAPTQKITYAAPGSTDTLYKESILTPLLDRDIRNEAIQTAEDFSDLNPYLQPEIFTLSTERDTVIETGDGAVIFVPKNAFSTEKPEVDLLVQTAIETEDILFAGLSTKTMEGDNLETAGMFYINAYDKGKSIPLKKTLTVDIPKTENKPGMQLYEGVKDTNGTIAWTNPKPISEPLQTVDITTLDFYPPGYEAKMESKGYTKKNFVDSVYYSFSGDCGVPESAQVGLSDEEFIHGGNSKPRKVSAFFRRERTREARNSGFADTSVVKDYFLADNAILDSSYSLNSSKQVVKNDCGIDPASIQPIWNEKFNNTNLATKNFEERMPFIHQTCNQEVLNVYVNNLDKNLSTVDSLAAKKAGSLYSQFMEFAKKGEGKVDVSNEASKALSAYYDQKREMIADAVQSVQRNYWDEQAKLDKTAAQKSSDLAKNDRDNASELRSSETAFNTQEIYRELGIKKKYPLGRNFASSSVTAQSRFNQRNPGWNAPKPKRIPLVTTLSTFRLTVQSAGWRNIDCINAATSTRETVKIKNGTKTTQLVFEDWKGIVEQGETYDQLFVYMIPNKFTSYVKLSAENGEYNYRLNQRLGYKMAVLGWKGEEVFYQIENAKKGNQEIKLIKGNEEEIKTLIETQLPNVKTLKDNIDLGTYLQKDKARHTKNTLLKAFRNELRPVVYPCTGEIWEYDVAPVGVKLGLTKRIESDTIE